LQKEGHDVPAMDNRPILYDDLLNDYTIFTELSKTRRVDGMSGYVFHIEFSEIEAYLQLMEISDFHQRQRLIKRIEFMDSTYCKQANEKKK